MNGYKEVIARQGRRRKIMFTGLIQHVGKVVLVRAGAGASEVQVELGPLAAEVRAGDSVCCDGCCLTISGLSEKVARFAVVRETLSRTTLGEWRPGQAVNLELALRAGDRLGGHFVQGHVDGVAFVEQVTERSDDRVWTFATSETLTGVMLEKGSVAVDGVSLTIAALAPGRFTVALVPATLARTALGRKRPGAKVNVEADFLGRYVLMALERLAPPVREQIARGRLTRSWLEAHGF